MWSKTFSLRNNQQKRLSEFLGFYGVICVLNGGGGGEGGEILTIFVNCT
jgi:hypothetical protein